MFDILCPVFLYKQHFELVTFFRTLSLFFFLNQCWAGDEVIVFAWNSHEKLLKSLRKFSLESEMRIWEYAKELRSAAAALSIGNKLSEVRFEVGAKVSPKSTYFFSSERHFHKSPFLTVTLQQQWFIWKFKNRFVLSLNKHIISVNMLYQPKTQ